MQLTFKKKRGTEKEYAHTEVYHGDCYLGYFMPNHSKFAPYNHNWNFVSKHAMYIHLANKTKEGLIADIQALADLTQETYEKK